MAEESKMFGSYQGARVSSIPEGFLGAYAQISKNLADTGAQVGKGIGDLITGYQAHRAQEDALNEQTKSPVFMEGLNKSLTGIAQKRTALEKALIGSGIDPETGANLDLEDDPSNPQNTNYTEEQQKQLSLLKAYKDAEKEGVAFLKDPSKFDNKRKLQLIGSVTSVNALFDKEKEAATEKESADRKAAAAKVDLATKTMALTKAAEDRAKGALPSVKEAQSAVQSAINWSTTADMATATQELKTVDAQIAILEAAEQDGGVPVPKQLYAKQAALKAFVDEKTKFATGVPQIAKIPIPEGTPTEKYFLSVEQAEERIAELDKEIEAAVKNGGDVRGLTQMRNGLQVHIETAFGDSVWAGDFLSERQTFDTQVSLNRKYIAALAHLETLSATTTKEGGAFIPSLSTQDKETLWTMIVNGSNDVYDVDRGMHYSVSESGELIEKPLTESEIKSLDAGGTRRTSSQKASDVAAAVKLKAAQATALFGGYNVESVTFDKERGNPKAGTQTIRRYVPTSYETVLFVPNFPQFSLQVSGRMSGDGTSTSENVRTLRENLVTDNTTLNAIARAMTALYARDGDGKPIPELDPTMAAKTGGYKLRANWDGDEGQAAKEEYARAIFDIKRGLGKGLGPLGPSDYALINSKVSTPIPWSNISTSSPTFVKDVIQAGFWDDYVKDPMKYFLDLQGIATEKYNGVRKAFEQGIGAKAVDDNGEVVDGHFAVRNGLFQSRGRLDQNYVANNRAFNVDQIVRSFDTAERTEIAKQGIKDFENLLFAEAQNDKRLNFLIQQWTAARASAPNITAAERTGAKKEEWEKWVRNSYEPYWRELIIYLHDQGLSPKVTNKWKYHLSY